MNKYIALCALGVIAADARKHHRKQHHKHQALHTQQLSSQVLQQEIEQLRDSYAELEQKFEKLEKTVKKNSLVQSPYGLAGPGGPAQPSPQPFVRGEKQWMDNAQNINDWSDGQTEKANTRLPYQSTAQVYGPNKYGLAGKGGPAQPSPQPFVRGEKQWMDNAQNIGDWGENQMEIANARIPYWSTIQVESEGLPNKFGLAGKGGPAQPSPQPFTRGEKQWMDNAQNIGNWGENQMEIANARIPYWSTIQLDSEGPNSYGLSADKKGKPIPGAPANPSPQPFVRGEKQWMDNAQNIGNWGENQMEIANARIPYWSTLVQTSNKDFNDDYEKEVDMNILYEKDMPASGAPEKVLTESNVPLSQHLVQIMQDDDSSKIESMMMEDTNIPLNLRLVHIETQEGDELIKIE